MLPHRPNHPEAAMKEQYVGDVNDYRKYALLRALADEESTIGMCWMLTPPDGRADGNKIDYLQRTEWAKFDAPLFELLRSIVGEPCRRRLHAIEASDILPRAVYLSRILPDARDERCRYFAEAKDKFKDCELVFFDPDNGIEVTSIPKGRRNSAKYVYWDEISTAYAARQSVLVYQHFPRENRRAFVDHLARRFIAVAPDAILWAFCTAHVAFLLAIHPRQRETLLTRARAVESRWTRDFIDPQPLGCGTPHD